MVECQLRGTGDWSFNPRPWHTKVMKNSNSFSLLDTQTFGLELGLVDPVSGWCEWMGSGTTGYFSEKKQQMSHDMTKPTKWLCAQPRLRSAWASEWTVKTDQTGQMLRLIWIFAGHTLILLVLSCRGSYFVGQAYSVVHRECSRHLVSINFING